MSAPPLSICIVYDRLYPASIGGAERWYYLLASRLAREGHRVTYITTRHWSGSEHQEIDGVTVLPLLTQREIYRRGRRGVLPILRFGVAVAWHLLRHGREYDVVQTSAMSSLPAFAVIACARRGRYRAVLDWWEVWPYRYWRQYLGPAAGVLARIVQRVIARAPHHPIVYSRLHGHRLHALRGRDDAPVLRGLLPGGEPSAELAHADPVIVSFGRLIPEKQVPALVPALALARETVRGLSVVIIGEGPDAAAIQRAVNESGQVQHITLSGFVPEDALRAMLSRALCLVLLSRREGYGLVVAEAAALGVPSVVLDHPDSAATELIVDGVNGVLCPSPDADEVASAILRVHNAGHGLRLSTRAWFRDNATELTIEGTLPRLLTIYRGDASTWTSARTPREQRSSPASPGRTAATWRSICSIWAIGSSASRAAPARMRRTVSPISASASSWSAPTYWTRRRSSPS